MLEIIKVNAYHSLSFNIFLILAFSIPVKNEVMKKKKKNEVMNENMF